MTQSPIWKSERCIIIFAKMQEKYKKSPINLVPIQSLHNFLVTGGKNTGTFCLFGRKVPNRKHNFFEKVSDFRTLYGESFLLDGIPCNWFQRNSPGIWKTKQRGFLCLALPFALPKTKQRQSSFALPKERATITATEKNGRKMETAKAMVKNVFLCRVSFCCMNHNLDPIKCFFLWNSRFVDSRVTRF